MNGYLAQTLAVIDAVAIHGPMTYAWYGHRAPAPPPDVRRQVSPGVARAWLVESLAARLYADFYQPGVARPTRDLSSRRSGGDATFVADLTVAANGGSLWRDGWELAGEDGDEALARSRRNGVVLRVPARDYRAMQAVALVGERVALRFNAALPAYAPGFFTALGELPLDDAEPLVRLYWNLRAGGAARFVRDATARLNAARVPFQLKVVNHPDAFDRADAGTLYLPASDLELAAPLLRDLRRELAGALKARVPALTLALAPGLGLAEDLGGASFGAARCAVLAEGLVRGWEQRRRTRDERLLTVGEAFAEAGVSFEAPYLRSGSPDRYAALFPGPPPRARAARLTLAPLDIASGIGRTLAHDALWAGERCAWFGSDPRDPRAVATLGPDLYGGVSGVALFLAELAVATGDAEFRRVALGALRQALATTGQLEAPNQLGLYTGLPGIALIAARVGTLLDDGAALDGARHIVENLRSAARPRERDLLSGLAGAIVALLALREVADPALELAIAYGHELLAAAEHGVGGLCWRSVAHRQTLPLTGLAHGAAGIGLAFVELCAATDDIAWADAARGAFAWEDSWFDAPAGNWPDFRDVTGSSRRQWSHLPRRAHWCHGAPGIALARLHAWRVLGDEACRELAGMALETTCHAVVNELAAGEGNFSLCHGLTGNAEILLLGAAAFPDHGAAWRVAALDVAQASARQLAAGRALPLGLSGATPGFMLGLAGVARFFLRMHEPALPSALLPVCLLATGGRVH